MANKNCYTIAIISFLLLFLLTIFLFSKGSVEPSLPLYRDFLSKIASPQPTLPNSPADSPSPTHQPISPTESIESNISQTSNNYEFSAENKKYPVAENESLGQFSDNNDNLSMERAKVCDLYMGTWVKDEEYPVYKPSSCPYVDDAFDCHRNGRNDSLYLKWRWKPDGCDLPRFNATDFLERLRGKRLLLVGDSLNRNQFESLLCLLHEGLPDKSRMNEIHGYRISRGKGYYAVKFLDYNCTVEYVRSHFLVKETRHIDAQGHAKASLSIDQIHKTAGQWKHVDILVFNSAHWWVDGKTTGGRNYYKEGDYLYPKLDPAEAYRRALKTWGKWVDNNIQPTKQLVFFRGYSSLHYRGGDWNSGGSCYGETEPIYKGDVLDTYPWTMKIVEEVIKEMQIPVILLNVTRLTNFRKDGHPSIYSKKRKVSMKWQDDWHQDCNHWCLPGIPDAWNELIYATLVFKQTIPRYK